ncbi:hypothetical protein [Brevundimonas sp. NIBR11]|uniref:hypothetical protein n=1 Tax=Brevundimonas sp. NIBR11 TaxID=3015999 RepID=UPI0022F02649|nr:hypothetical protein [Brevundimonas sp. NIBR11]WGM31437.1 hypothetical protein KKHFBJBL_01683 [Brevundimonas sp. NIBR11]
MTEPDSSPKRLTNVAGVIGLATAVIGLVGTGVTVWSGMRSEDKANAEPAALVSTAAEESLDDLPAQIDGYMSGPAYVDWQSAHLLCYQKDADGSCIVTAGVEQRGPRAVRLRETFFTRLPHPAYEPLDLIVADDFAEHDRKRPDGVARFDLVDYVVTRQGLCINRDARAGGAARTLVFGIYEGEPLVPVSSSALTAFRTQLREDLAGEAVGDSQCWRFRLEADQLRQDYFIDGVIQPDRVVMFDVLPAGQQPYLRIP